MHVAVCLTALVLSACGGSGGDEFLSTYEGEPVGNGPFSLTGTLEVVDGCVVFSGQGAGDVVDAVLRLPSDGDSDVSWSDDTLRFHGKTYRVGDELSISAKGVAVAALPDGVSKACENTDLDFALSAVAGTTDLGR